MAFVSTITGSSAAQYCINGNATLCRVVGGLIVKSPALLGTLRVTWRWTDTGVNLTRVEDFLLTVLGNSRAFVFPLTIDIGTVATWEAALVGVTGGFSAELNQAEF